MPPVIVTAPVVESVVKAPVLAVVAPTVPLMFIEAVPVKFVTTPEDGVPKAGVTSVGDVDITTLPVPVIALLTRFLLALVNTAWLAVRLDSVVTPVTPSVVDAVIALAASVVLATVNVPVAAPILTVVAAPPRFSVVDTVLKALWVAVPTNAPEVVIAPTPSVPTPDMLPVVSAMMTTEFWMVLPSVPSKRATALSVEEAGPST